MDLKDTIQIFCSPGKGVLKSSVSVEWCESYNMKHHPDLHKHIEEIWSKKCQSSILLYNATKFRLDSVKIDTSSDYNIKFLLGTTNYKEFIGTHYAPFAEQLVKDGIKDYSIPAAYLSNPVGVGGILETKDENLVFMRRSNICAEMPGLLDRPGGHPEPNVVTVEQDQLSEHSKSLAAKDEIFDSVLKEITDEVNILPEYLSYPVLLGVSYNPKTFRRPSLEFYVRCSLTTNEIKEFYSRQTHAEKDESTDLIFVPVSDVLDENKLKKCNFYSDLTHAAQSAIYLLQIYLSK